MSEEKPIDSGNAFQSEVNLTPSPISGTTPPVEHRFTKDNKAGGGRKPNAGNTIKECINSLSAKGLTRSELATIARSNVRPSTEVIAAGRLLEAMERPDLADFTELVSGEKTLRQVRDDGIDTAVLKKVKETSRYVPSGDGEYDREVTREVEAHDRSRAASVALLEQTDGKPSQTIDITGPPAIFLTVNVLGRKFVPAGFQQQHLVEGGQHDANA